MTEANGGPGPACPWCSATLPDPQAERCPSCDAQLAATPAEGEIRGVTSIDPEAILRARTDAVRPRNRILSFITGDVGDETGGPASPESLAPPPDEVRREILRLQIEAERADLTAETVALKSDALAELGIPLSELGGDESVLGPTSGAAPDGDAPTDAPPVPPPPPGQPDAAEPSGDEPTTPA